MPRSFTLGMGIELQREFNLTRTIVIRPYRIQCNHIELMDKTVNQIEYGLICSYAEKITFELESTGRSKKLAALEGWNSRWSLVLLSTMLRKPIYMPINKIHISKSDSDQFILANNFVGAGIFHEPYKVSQDELDKWKSMYPKFNKLTNDARLRFASSIAFTQFLQPRLSVRIATRWSGIEAMIGLDQELRFRIALYVSKLFGESPNEIKKLFNDTKKLYDGRSKCVHGTGLKTRKQEEELYNKSLRLLSDLILKACESGKVPDMKDIEKIILS